MLMKGELKLRKRRMGGPGGYIMIISGKMAAAASTDGDATLDGENGTAMQNSSKSLLARKSLLLLHHL